MEQKKLKIAFLSRFVGVSNRGVESHVLELSKRLAKNFQVDVLSGSDADSLRKVLRGKYDLVIPTNGRWQALKMSLGRIAGGYKLLVAGHAGVGRDEIWNAALAIPDIYVALTDYEKNWIQNWAWKSWVVKIPNGVDIQKFTGEGEKASIDLPKPLILSVGALAWYKHHEKTIAALGKMGKGSLLIMGDGPMKDELLTLGKDMVNEGRLKILVVAYEEIPKYFRAADVFTLPSWDREAFGIVYLEAMASGLPVVAPDDLSRREIIGPAGILTDVDNPQIFAGALEEAINKSWGDIPRNQAEKFSWDKICKMYEQLLKEMWP